MNGKIQLSFALLLSLISLICFGFMAFFVTSHHIVHFDSTIISFITSFKSPTVTLVMKFFTFVGSSKSVIVLSFVTLFCLYKALRHQTELVLFIVVIGGANILFYSLKLFFHRARPDLHRLIEVSGYSFPSGHATNAFALYGVLAFLLWRHIHTQWGRTILLFISILMIFLIGISRIYLGVHYPSDIIAGYFISGFWLSIVIWFFRRYKE